MMIQEKDIRILNGLRYDEAAEPNFEITKYYLIWPDERPEESPEEHLSREGREFLYDLWITRGLIHRLLPYEKWGLDPQGYIYFKERWEYGLIHIPNWPGFKRIELSEADKKYLIESMEGSSKFLLE